MGLGPRRRGQQRRRGDGRRFDAGRYDLTDEERKAFESKDVAALYQLGLHPVLLNRLLPRRRFRAGRLRKLLQPFAEAEERKARWQK